MKGNNINKFNTCIKLYLNTVKVAKKDVSLTVLKKVTSTYKTTNATENTTPPRFSYFLLNPRSNGNDKIKANRLYPNGLGKKRPTTLESPLTAIVGIINITKTKYQIRRFWDFNNKLEVTIEDGTTVTVNVLDIVDSLEFNKTYVIYTVNEEETTIFASILNEDEDSYTLETITNQREIDFIDKEIDRVVEELSEGEE